MSTFGELTAPKVEQTGPGGDGAFVYVDISSIDNQGKRIVEPKRLSTDAAPSRARQRLQKGDVLISMTRPNLNAVAIVPPDLDGAIGSTGFHVLRANADADPHWLYYAVQSNSFVKAMCDLVKGALYPAVRPKDIREYSINPPPLAKQREIVAELEKQFSRLDEAVANLQRVKANLKRYKASVLKSAVEGRLVETEASIAHREGRSYETGEQLLQRILEERRAKWSGRGKYKLPASPLKDGLPPIPDGWTWSNADQLTHLITSGSRGWGDFYSDTGVLFIRAQDIKTDALNLPDAARVDVPIDAEGTRSSVTEGDILVTITGANVTKSALVPALGELAFVSQHVALMKLAMPETASFVFSWIVSPANGRKVLESWAYGAGKPGLSLEQVRALPIALPPLAEQARIVAEVDRHLSIVREVESEVDTNLKRTQALRQATLQKAFCTS